MTLRKIYEGFIAGTKHHSGLSSGVQEGDKLDLVHEPSNKFDPKAIRIDFGGHKLGYIKAKDTDILHDEIAQGNQPIAYLVGVNLEAPSYELLRVRVLVDESIPKVDTVI